MKKKIIYSLISVLLAYQPVAFAADITTNTTAAMSYEEGLAKIQGLIKSSDFKRAEDLTNEMLRIYPGNQEFQSILARLYSWQGKYEDSVKLYQDILSKKYSPEVKTELDKVIASKNLDDIKNLQSMVGPKEYEAKLREYYESGKDPYNSGYLLGMHYIEDRDFDKAAKVFEELQTRFPKDTNLKILYLESLIENKNYTVARKYYSDLKQEEEEEVAFIDRNRGDLEYKLHNNYFMLKGGYYLYPPNIQNEKELTLELSQGIGNFTLIPRYSNISRYGLNDNQLGLDLYSTLGSKRYGYVSFTASPDAQFLPVWTAGAEIFQGIDNFEFSFGYTRMNFQTSGVNILKPGVRVYLPLRTSIDEKLYYVPDNQAYSLLSTLNWEPSHIFSAFYTFGFGQLAERLTSSQDLSKLNSFSHTLGLRYRFMPELSINTEFLWTHREGLYDITGASVYTKYWW
jgi:YaiO family outer membrane protein